MQWQIAPVNMIQVIKDAVDATSQLIADKKIHLMVDLPSEVRSISGDGDQLIQAMVNLLSNAVKFCHDEHGNIMIEMIQEHSQLKVSVRDNGIGISAKDQQAVFEQFRQITPPTGGGRPPGSGLGLAITKRIIEFHNGRISVHSRPGRGATFTFVLPTERSFRQ